ncbi:hypothetical protein [Echinicola sp. 20G]|uniref:hypothetical protein n=1 Tax=Echinicola sp. 20G TaxID=2781961 RepID=UPI0019106606|nr:hypothetical protein [Echinicola sp. 20G]
MKKSLLYLSLLSFLLIFSCNNGDDEDDEPAITGSGTISLQGSDTDKVGTSLVVGNVAYGRDDLTGLEESIIVVDEGSTITDTVHPKDPMNTFVMVVSDIAISMSIIKNGTKYDYTCAMDACGEIDFDVSGKKAVLDNTIVVNAETSEVLVMDGVITW